MRSILVVRLSSMGDVILVTALVRQIQRTWPDAAIDVAVDERFAEVWAHNPRLRHVWKIESRSATDTHIDDTKLAIAEANDGELYDLVVDLQKNVRSRLLVRGLGKQLVTLNKHRLEKLILVWLKRRPAVTTPVIDRYRQTLQTYPLVLDVEGPELWLEEEFRQGALRGRRGRESTGRIAIAPGAHHETKRWPVERFAEVCKQLSNLGYRPVLVGGPADVDRCTAVATAAGVDIVRADGATSLASTIQTLDGCDLLITNDTGVMHIASARRVPIVAIFGGTVPELGFAPYGVPHTIIQHDVACRPCSHIGKSRCPRGHFLCMTGIPADDVVNGARKLLSR